MSDSRVILVPTKARRSPLMIKPWTNMCVRCLAKRICVWFSWLSEAVFQPPKGNTVFQVLHKVFTNDDREWTSEGTLISCVFLWLLKVHCTLYRIRPPVGFGDTCFSWMQIFVVSSSPIWSLQTHLGKLRHIGVLSLFYIRANGMMPLFPLANTSYALTLAHCWPAFSEKVCIVCLYMCVSFCHRYFKSRYISYNLTYFPNALGKAGQTSSNQCILQCVFHLINVLHSVTSDSGSKFVQCVPRAMINWCSLVTLLSMIKSYPNESPLRNS